MAILPCCLPQQISSSSCLIVLSAPFLSRPVCKRLCAGSQIGMWELLEVEIDVKRHTYVHTHTRTHTAIAIGRRADKILEGADTGVRFGLPVPNGFQQLLWETCRSILPKREWLQLCLSQAARRDRLDAARLLPLDDFWKEREDVSRGLQAWRYAGEVGCKGRWRWRRKRGRRVSLSVWLQGRFATGCECGFGRSGCSKF